MYDQEVQIIIDLVDVDKQEKNLIKDIKGKNATQAAILIKNYLLAKLEVINGEYILLLREKERKGLDIKKQNVRNDVLGTVGLARNDTIMRKIEIGENEKRKKDMLISLLHIVFVVVASCSLIPSLYYFNVLSLPVSVTAYILVLLALITYVFYKMINMKHERNPLSIREKLFRHPDMKMIFQSKMLSDMEDIDEKVNELESLVKTVNIPPELMKEYIDDEYERN